MVVWQNLWSSIDVKARKEVLLDFIKLEDWLTQNCLEFQRLGLYHAVRGDQSVLVHLGQKIGMSEAGVNLLARLAKLDFSDLRYFCSCLIESAKGSLRLNLVKCTTPAELDEAKKALLQKEIEEQLGTEVLMRYSVEPQILGGSILEIDYVSFDSSYGRYLKLIEKRCVALLRGGN